MKSLLTVLFAACLSFTAANAQDQETENTSNTTEVVANTPKKKLTPEEKEAAKLKKEQELKAAFKGSGVTKKEEKQARLIMDETAAINKELKKDDSLSPEEIKEKSKENNKAKDAKLKELFGKEKYKAFKDIQKAQKEAAKAE